MTELVRLISEAYNGVEFEFIQKTELGMDPLYWYTKDGKIINNVNKWKLFDFCFTDLKITNKTGLTLRNFYAHPSAHSDLLLFASPAFKPDPLAPYLPPEIGWIWINQCFIKEFRPDQSAEIHIKAQGIDIGEGFVHNWYWAELNCFRVGSGQTIADDTRIPFKIEPQSG